MADLANKLVLRRKGIAGNNKVSSSQDIGAMDKISGMIPPPPQQDSDNEYDGDVDWDD